MNIGIIGTGRMGTARAKHIAQIDGVDLKWICSREANRAAEFIAESQLDEEMREPPLALGDWREAIHRRDTDGIVITTPNTVHYEMVAEALTEGKAILVEYPHAAVPEEGLRLLQLAEKQRSPLHVGLTHKYSPMHKTIMSYARQTAEIDLGRPIAYHMATCSGNPISRWYDKDDLSGGMFISSLYHMIDEALDYFGEYKDFKASYFAVRDVANVILKDSASLMIRFRSRCTAHLTYARGLPKPGIGSSHTFIFENGYIVQEHGSYRLLRPDKELELKVSGDDSLLADTTAFVDLMRNPGSRNDTPDDAQRTLDLAYRAQQEATV